VATARGTVECPALGGRLPINGGTFNLLKIAASGTREMRYTLPFTARDGERYLLVGVKYVAQDAGLDAWADTTTLFTTIYRGDSEDGPVVGSGVLELRIPDLARQMTTFRLLRGRGLVASALTILGFSKYFVSSLWRTYVRRS